MYVHYCMYIFYFLCVAHSVDNNTFNYRYNMKFVIWSMSGPAWRDVPAVVFMATSLRDAGGKNSGFNFTIEIYNLTILWTRQYLIWIFFFATAIEQTEALLKHACMLQPENPHTLLTYVHTLEVRLFSLVMLVRKFIGLLEM